MGGDHLLSCAMSSRCPPDCGPAADWGLPCAFSEHSIPPTWTSWPAGRF